MKFEGGEQLGLQSGPLSRALASLRVDKGRISGQTRFRRVAITTYTSLCSSSKPASSSSCYTHILDHAVTALVGDLWPVCSGRLEKKRRAGIFSLFCGRLDLAHAGPTQSL